MRKFLATAGIAAILLGGCTVPADDAEAPSADSVAESQATGDSGGEPEQTEDTAGEGTVAQMMALATAEQYLATAAFSKAGLLDQLSSEYGSQFEKADARWAVNHLDVDWNEQAVRAGQQYLDTMPFSRAALIDQLTSEYGSQFTRAQAVYAVNQLGL